jgi:hypothetical protein
MFESLCRPRCLVLELLERGEHGPLSSTLQVQNSPFPFKSRSLNRLATRRGRNKHNSPPTSYDEVNTICHTHHPTQISITPPPLTIWLPTGMPTSCQPLSQWSVSPLIRHDIHPAAGQRGKNNENTWTLLGGLLLLCVSMCFVVLYR